MEVSDTLVLVLQLAPAVIAIALLCARWRSLRNLNATEDEDTCVHEVGHALLFAVWRELQDPKVTLTTSLTSHSLPSELILSMDARRWLMLVCLAGRAAEIASSRNAGLLKSPWFQLAMDRVSSADGDGPKWLELAKCDPEVLLQQGGRRRTEAIARRRAQDMALLHDFFAKNLALLRKGARALQTSRELDAEAVSDLLQEVQFTDDISPRMLFHTV
jgi:hypothetical protein